MHREGVRRAEAGRQRVHGDTAQVSAARRGVHPELDGRGDTAQRPARAVRDGDGRREHGGGVPVRGPRAHLQHVWRERVPRHPDSHVRRPRVRDGQGASVVRCVGGQGVQSGGVSRRADGVRVYCRDEHAHQDRADEVPVAERQVAHPQAAREGAAGGLAVDSVRPEVRHRDDEHGADGGGLSEHERAGEVQVHRAHRRQRAGVPIVGDVLYGVVDASRGEPLRLVGGRVVAAERSLRVHQK